MLNKYNNRRVVRWILAWTVCGLYPAPNGQDIRLAEAHVRNAYMEGKKSYGHRR